MYSFFRSFNDPSGAPSFAKFAQAIGATVADLTSFRRYGEFDRAFIECGEIRRDYLTDKALTKQFDASTVKLLLSEREEEEKELSVDLKLTVVE